MSLLERYGRRPRDRGAEPGPRRGAALAARLPPTRGRAPSPSAWSTPRATFADRRDPPGGRRAAVEALAARAGGPRRGDGRGGRGGRAAGAAGLPAPRRAGRARGRRARRASGSRASAAGMARWPRGGPARSWPWATPRRRCWRCSTWSMPARRRPRGHRHARGLRGRRGVQGRADAAGHPLRHGAGTRGGAALAAAAPERAGPPGARPTGRWRLPFRTPRAGDNRGRSQSGRARSRRWRVQALCRRRGDTDARARRRKLRRGFTTGSCATAAATAATRALLGQQPVGRGHDPSAGGHRRDVSAGALPVRRPLRGVRGDQRCRRRSGRHAPGRGRGAGHLRDPPGLELAGGVGVGVVTRPGLGLEVGGPAINPVPRRMIAEHVSAAAGERLAEQGLRVEIAMPRGEELARRTLTAGWASSAGSRSSARADW